MDRSRVAQAETTIQSPANRVWQALTDPEMIKQYMFGSEIMTDWKVGSPIIYKGVWDGKPFEDKGEIVEVLPERRLVTTHWSPLSGTVDSPENYHRVTYEVSPQEGSTRVTIIQDNNADEQEKEHSEKNWKLVLESMKKLLEGRV